MGARRFALEVVVMLDVGDGHRLWFEQKGQGVDALVLHGGPGSVCRPQHYDLFDLNRYRVTLLDQRGCGRSTPSASETLAALASNTTTHLISDIEALRIHLGVDAWVLFGGSWGTTLALAYAQAHPTRVRAMVLAGVATTAARDLQWLYGDIGAMFPEAYDAFCEHVPGVGDSPLKTPMRIRAYADLLRDPDHAQAAADAWCQWETAIFGGDIGDPASRYADPAFRLGFARIVTHYFAHGAWLSDDELRENVAILAHIQCKMIHSRFDPSCPLRGPWALSREWPASELRVLGGATHSALDTEMTVAIRAATDALGV
ncbi:alpha/beta fold hydrolase [Tateyamaria omphalii]|uniref:alpha/beta fold hydrolase n=1 Tax=Tateyamaria omphalii TaxID=299262 RepID=UPI001C9A04B7|nr:alpha/beta fold hydrolase [Tateyamaria omphalii]MBY5932548.1 alpha/beta fold hydrolase [Tateyamaria omphalii]